MVSLFWHDVPYSRGVTPTITITDEAREYFERNPDPALRDLVDRATREYADWFKEERLLLDTDEDPDTGRVQVLVVAEVPAESAESAMERLTEYMRRWLPAHTREEHRKVGFSVRYV